MFAYFKPIRASETRKVKGNTEITTRVDSASKLDVEWPDVGEWIGLWNMVYGFQGVGKVLQRYDEAAPLGKKSKRKYPETFFDILLYVDRHGKITNPTEVEKLLCLKVGIGNTCIVEQTFDDKKIQEKFDAIDEKLNLLLNEIKQSKSKFFYSNVLEEKQVQWKRDYESKEVAMPEFTNKKEILGLFGGVRSGVREFILQRHGSCSWVLCDHQHSDVAKIRDWANKQGGGEIRCYIKSWKGVDYEFAADFKYERGMDTFIAQGHPDNVNRGNLHLEFSPLLQK